MKLTEITKEIRDSKRIAIMGHKGGDADCYGSAFALAAGLEKTGKSVRVVTGEEFPESLNFLFYYFSGEIVQDIDNIDLLILVDTSDIDKLSNPKLAKELIKRGIKVILVDHHFNGNLKEYVNFSFTDSEICSTSEIIYHLLVELNIVFDKDIATCLLAGIMGDTSSYQNQNTTKECFEISSELMKQGARQRVIANYLFGNKEVDSLKVWGLAMERLSLDKHYNIVTTYLLHDEIEKFGLSLDVLSGITNFLNSIKGARVVILVSEEEKGTIKVSMRTRDAYANVANIAKQLGGGGHIKASGFSFPGSLKILTEGDNSHIVIV